MSLPLCKLRCPEDHILLPCWKLPLQLLYQVPYGLKLPTHISFKTNFKIILLLELVGSDKIPMIILNLYANIWTLTHLHV